MTTYLKGLLFVIFGFLPTYVFAQQTEVSELEPGRATVFEEELWYFDQEAEKFLPKFHAERPDPHFIGFYLHLGGDEERFLEICSPVSTSIWVDKQLIVGSSTARCNEISLSDWKRRFGKDSVFVTLRSSAVIVGQSRIAIGSRQALGPQESSLNPLRRSPDVRSEFLVLFAFIFLAIISIYRQQFPRIFKSFLDLNRMLSMRGRDDTVADFRLLSTPSIVSHVLVSLLSGFFLCLFIVRPGDWLHNLSPGLTAYFRQWLIFSLVILAFLLAKRLLIQLFGSIFKMSGAVYLQVFEFMRGSFLLLTIGLCIFMPLFYLSEGTSEWLLKNLPWFASAFVMTMVLLLFFKLAFETRYQKLHLFSYLCATETLPAILLLKWMFF